MDGIIEAIENFFLETVGKELCVLFCSMLPIIECRGAVPLGCGLGMPWWQSFLFAAIGNLIPVPFILLLIRYVLNWMESCRLKLFNKIAGWLKRKVEKKKGTIEKYSYVGVAIFVAIPFPGTGAWTGSLISAMLGMDWKKSILAATVGVLISCTIMTLLSYAFQMVL